MSTPRRTGGLRIAPLPDEHRPTALALWRERWGSTRVVSRGVVHEVEGLPALAALDGGALAGVATYRIEGGACEVVTLDAVHPGGGAGRALLEAVAGTAREAGCGRLWLVTTNDNTAALRFYQRFGMCLVALRPGALDGARRLKPEIPRTGRDGIPLRDELELELPLT